MCIKLLFGFDIQERDFVLSIALQQGHLMDSISMKSPQKVHLFWPNEYLKPFLTDLPSN